MPQTYYTYEPDTESRFQCRHIFTGGHRCKSPALRQENFCYYHHTTRKPVPKQELAKRRSKQATIQVQFPEDQSAIQHTIGQVLQLLGSNQIDTKRAGLLLYGLQIASQNLPKANPKTRPMHTVDEVTEDGLAPVAEFREDGSQPGPAERQADAWIASARAHRSTLQPSNPSPTIATPGTLPEIQARAHRQTSAAQKQEDRPPGRPAARRTSCKAICLHINGRGERIRTSDPLVPNQFQRFVEIDRILSLAND
jgi:hypothetical protein